MCIRLLGYPGDSCQRAAGRAPRPSPSPPLRAGSTAYASAVATADGGLCPLVVPPPPPEKVVTGPITVPTAEIIPEQDISSPGKAPAPEGAEVPLEEVKPPAVSTTPRAQGPALRTAGNRRQGCARGSGDPPPPRVPSLSTPCV